MNFHPDKQLFQVAGTGVQTTDPWITRPALSPYTMGMHTQTYHNKVDIFPEAALSIV
jgi:hypothetical protein